MPIASTYDPATASLYVGRVARVPPIAAQQAVAEYRSSIRDTQGQRPAPGWAVRASRAQLTLNGPGELSRRDRLDPICRWTGKLGPRRGRTAFRVEVDLSPWSTAACELAMRPIGRRLARTPRVLDAYFWLAGDALDHLCDILERLAWEAVRDALQGGDRRRRPLAASATAHEPSEEQLLTGGAPAKRAWRNGPVWGSK